MEKLMEALAEKGVDASAMSEEQVRKVAKAVGVDPTDYLPRGEVKIVDYTNKRKETNKFVTTPSYVVGRKKDGTARTVRGLFLRVEAARQALADLQVACDMLDSED